MQRKQNTVMIKRCIDVCMTILLLCLMAYQVTGEQAHEWTGMGMTLLVIIHQVLNRKWYASIFKGNYNAYRILTTIVNVLLLLSFALTAFCGMSMSGYAVPFLYGMTKVSFARRMHLSMSHWAFVLMGLHLGLHIPAMAAKWKMANKVKWAVSVLFCILAGIGLFLFLKNGMPDYLLFRVPFAFLDYEKAGSLVILENILMLLFWSFIGTQAALLCRNLQRKDEKKKNPLVPVILMMAAVILGLILNMAFPGNKEPGSGNTGWNPAYEDANEKTENNSNKEASDIEDGFQLIWWYLPHRLGKTL